MPAIEGSQRPPQTHNIEGTGTDQVQKPKTGTWRGRSLDKLSNSAKRLPEHQSPEKTRKKLSDFLIRKNKANTPATPRETTKTKTAFNNNFLDKQSKKLVAKGYSPGQAQAEISRLTERPGATKQSVESAVKSFKTAQEQNWIDWAKASLIEKGHSDQYASQKAEDVFKQTKGDIHSLQRIIKEVPLTAEKQAELQAEKQQTQQKLFAKAGKTLLSKGYSKTEAQNIAQKTWDQVKGNPSQFNQKIFSLNAKFSGERSTSQDLRGTVLWAQATLAEKGLTPSEATDLIDYHLKELKNSKNIASQLHKQILDTPAQDGSREATSTLLSSEELKQSERDDKSSLNTLGLGNDASLNDVKKAYRKLALSLHPDKHNNSEEAKSKFQHVGLAYQHLTTSHTFNPKT